MKRWSLLLAIAALAPLAGCVSAATYERDVGAARTEAKLAQQAASMQVETLKAAMAALQRSLEAEAELRAVTVRALESQIARLEAQKTEATVALDAIPKGTKGEAIALRAELVKLREQEQANSARMRRVEEAMQRLSNKGAITAADLDVRNPWSKLHAYPY